MYVPALSQKYKSFDALNKGTADGLWTKALKGFIQNFLEIFTIGKTLGVIILVISLIIGFIMYGSANKSETVGMGKDRLYRGSMALLMFAGVVIGIINIMRDVLLKIAG